MNSASDANEKLTIQHVKKKYHFFKSIRKTSVRKKSLL